jgi:hypothetical protein
MLTLHSQVEPEASKIKQEHSKSPLICKIKSFFKRSVKFMTYIKASNTKGSEDKENKTPVQDQGSVSIQGCQK